MAWPTATAWLALACPASRRTPAATPRFQGCWLTIQIPIPTTYTAPQPGWWKIQYNIGTGTGASDLTTWQVEIRGNPVHLVLP